MADIRINALATTAASTASDDFVAVDGSANGTRKLNAYSPTFGGNLTVSGTGTNSFSGPIAISASGTDAAGFRAITTSSAQTGYVRVGADTASAVCDIGVGGSAHSLTAIRDKLYTYSNGAVRSTMDTSGNLVLTTGNLTVSGGTIGTAASTNLTLAGGSTGASLVLGQGTNGSAQLVSKGTGRIILQGQNPTTIAQGNESFVFSGLNQGPGNVQLALGMNETGGFFPWLQSYRVGGSAGSYLVLQPAAGNLLIGGTTDSGNGKLQLATHTTSAGGIGFGTDVSVYRTSTSALAFNGTTGDPQFQLARGGTIQASFLLDGASVYFGSASTQPLILRTNGTTALTLDSSQNATFAGNVTLSNSGNAFFNLRYGSGGFGMVEFTRNSVNKGRIYQNSSDELFIESATANQAIKLVGTDATFAGNVTVNGTGTQSFNGTIALKAAAVGDGITLRESYAGNSLLFSVLQNSGDGTGATIAGADGAGSTTFSVNTQTGAATFSGSIAIGNTVNTVSPTSPNRTITMVIGGTTYYIHAKTTND